MKRIPGPRWLPGPVASLFFFTRPIEFVGWLRRRYGRVIELKETMLGNIVYVTDPKLISQIFKGDPNQMHAGNVNEILEPVVGKQSVLLLDEKPHMRMRKVLMPPFHGEAIKRYGELIEQITAREVERMPLGSPFAIREHTQAITLDVILRAVFGITEPRRTEEMRSAIDNVLSTNPLIIFKRLQRDLGPRSPWGKFLRYRARFDELIYDEIRHRRAQPQDGDGIDIFSLLVAARDEDGEPLTDQELRDELVTMLAAGHDTTAGTLSWVFERLLRNPDKLAKLRASIAAGEQDYLEAVCKETLRMRPVIMDIGRKLTRPFELDGYTVPAGHNVMPAILAVHYNEQVWPNPTEFRPERFIDTKIEPNSWIPFGGGVRRCIGAAFAMFEMQVVLRTMLERAEFRAADPKPEKIKFRGITIIPAKGGEVVLVERLEPPAREAADSSPTEVTA